MDGLIPVSIISLDRESNLGRLKTTVCEPDATTCYWRYYPLRTRLVLLFIKLFFIKVLDLYATFLNYSWNQAHRPQVLVQTVKIAFLILLTPLELLISIPKLNEMKKRIDRCTRAAKPFDFPTNTQYFYINLQGELPHCGRLTFVLSIKAKLFLKINAITFIFYSSNR